MCTYNWEEVNGSVQRVPQIERAAVVRLSPWETVLRWCGVYADLFFLRWANIRNEWYFHVILGPLFPLAMLGFLKMTGAIRDPESALYVTAGNAVLALVLGPMQSIANDLAWGKQRNDLEYLATLPFSKLQMILAFVSVSSIFTIPSMLFTIWVGKLWLGFPVHFSPMLLPIMILSALSMCGLGVFMGVYARNGHHANMMNTIAMGIAMFLSPVLIPFENLPLPLQWTSRLLPPSYAADAFRTSLSGGDFLSLLPDCAVLMGFTFGLLYLATKRLDWRVEK